MASSLGGTRSIRLSYGDRPVNYRKKTAPSGREPGSGGPLPAPAARRLTESTRRPGLARRVSLAAYPRSPTMAITLYDITHTTAVRGLKNLEALLDKALANAESRKIDPAVLLASRLAPDMFPLLRQVQIACDFAKSVPARIAGIEVAAYEDTEQSFAELHQRIAKTIALIEGLSVDQLNGSTVTEIVLRPGTPKEKTLSVQDYALKYGMPQFFFHVTTAYNVLRHNGVEIGKKDFMGAY